MNWSFSALMVYEACPYRFKLAKVDRIPEPPRPPDNPLERGSRIHDRCENFVKGTGPMDSEAKASEAFTAAFEHLQTLYAAGKATAEENWLFDADWMDTDRRNVWLWSKLDFSVTDEDQQLVIVGDYKTGKSTYKAIEHAEQLQLYAAVAALKYEWADTLITELWYLDEGHIKTSEYTRDDALKFVQRFDRRARVIFNDQIFRPNPNIITCKWCPYRSVEKGGTGHCKVAAV